jgi:hypothetical protein
MDTVPGAAAKPSSTISQPESVPPGCSGKCLLRSRAVRREDLPLGFLMSLSGSAIRQTRYLVAAGR